MRYPEPVAAAIILNEEEQVLLCKSSKWQNKYVVPGGHIELGETMEAALKREVMEETGLEIYGINLVGVKESIRGQGASMRHYIVFDFLCRTKGLTVSLNHEAESYAWAAFDDLGQFDLDPYTAAFFKAYLSDDQSQKKLIVFNASNE